MPDYKAMYYTVLRAQLHTVSILQNAHLEAEALFMESKDPLVLPKADGTPIAPEYDQKI